MVRLEGHQRRLPVASWWGCPILEEWVWWTWRGTSAEVEDVHSPVISVGTEQAGELGIFQQLSVPRVGVGVSVWEPRRGFQDWNNPLGVHIRGGSAIGYSASGGFPGFDQQQCDRGGP
jgi:hypothetical protein